MKSQKTFQVFFILLFLSGISLHVFSQGAGYPISYNNLIAGDTMILRNDVGFYDPDGLKAVLNPQNVYYLEFCPVCKFDSIWSYKTELYSDSTYDFYFAVPIGTLPGGYSPVFLFEENFVLLGQDINIYTPPFIFQQPRDTMVCEGDTTRFEVMALGNHDNDLLYKWYHNDVQYSEVFEGFSIIGYPQLQDTGRYYCVISNQYGIDTTHVARLDIFPVPANPGLPMGTDRFCPWIDSTAYSINPDPLATLYEWHLFPEVAGTIEPQNTSAVIIWNPAFSGIAELYVEVMGSKCEATSSEILEITIPGLSAPPEICIVGIDEETGKYRIVWEKSEIESEQLFRIYRESNQIDVYLEIGTVNPSELSVFTDPASAPDILSHRYKISYTDTCDNESELSVYHQTMHLAANLGIDNDVNLIWSEYKGIPFPAYNIYRGNHKDSLTLLMQVPSSVTSFTDDNPPEGLIYYQIGMSNPAGCNPGKKAGPDYSSSRSNLEQVYVSGIEEIHENKLFSIYPNPVEKELQIWFKKVISGSIQYTVYNSLGTIVLEGIIRVGSASLDVRSLSPGLYILQLSIDREAYSARFVINSKKY